MSGAILTPAARPTPPAHRTLDSVLGQASADSFHPWHRMAGGGWIVSECRANKTF